MYDRYDKGMYGIAWFSPYEMRITPSGYDEFDEPTAFVFVDGGGQMHHLEYYAANTWRARADQGLPFVLTKTGSGTGASYTLVGTEYRQWGFDDEGRMTYYDANNLTSAVERLTFTYDGSDRLWKVNAPTSDGRYLEFFYNDGTFTRRCTKAQLVAGSNNYDLVEYTYNASGKLYTVKRNPTYATSTHEYQYVYEYGDFDIVSGTPTWTPGNVIGKISYRINQEASPYRPLVAYKYGTASAASKEFVYDVGASPAAWRQTLLFDGHMFDHTPTLYYGDDTSDPKTAYITDYKNDLADVNYANTTAKMPPTHFFGADTGSGSGSGDAGYARLVGSMELQDSSSNWYPLWEAAYDLTNSDYMLRFRKLSATSYSTSNSTSAMTTSYTYHGTFKQWNDSVTNGEGETINYAYDTLLLLSSSPMIYNPRYGRLYQVSKDGLTTTYSYHLSGAYPDGLLSAIEDPYGNETTYEFDSRGNLTKTVHPDGNEVTRTYNDFGQVLTETRTHLGTTTYVYSDQTLFSDGTTTVPAGEKFLPPRIVEVRDATANTTRLLYTEASRLWKITDANGKSTEYTFDGRGRLVQVENEAGEVALYGYDKYDRVTKFSDGRGLETIYEFDPFGRITRETDPDSYYKEYLYSDDATGGCGCGSGGMDQVTRIRQEDGNFVYLSYDHAGRLEKVWYSSDPDLDRSAVAPHLTYSYDNADRVLSIQDTRLTTSGNTYSFTYDTGDTGRLEAITHPEGYTQEFVFQDDDQEDHYRRLIAYRDVDGHIVKHNYDALERLSTLTDGYGANTVYTYATTSDSTYPVGSIKRTAYGNNAKNDYTYDSLGRLDKVEHLNASSSVFDYVDLAYDPAGMITEKKRKDGASYFATFYTYDDAYRLIEELTKNGSGVEKTVRAYGYDDAGNRTSMAFDNDSITTKSTTYSYGNRNQIVSNTGYYRDGTTDTGSMSYTWDEKGNMLTRTGSTYEWNEDNRLARAYISGGDPKAELFQKFFKYDSAGRRILEYKSTDGIRKRSFFNGLTEEIKKVSVGTHGDTSFARTVQLTSASGESSGWANWGTRSWHVWDDDRFSQVTETVSEESNGKVFWETGDGWNITGKRTFAIWAKASADSAWVCICVKATDGTRYGLAYQGTTGSPYNSGNAAIIPVGSTSQDFANGEWVRLERDLQADLTGRFGKTLSCVTGIYLWSGGTTTPKMWIDDLSFSNSLTVEHNTLGGGVIGHILRNRSTNTSTYAATDRWFHYDQAGGVMSESDATGALAQTHYQDAFGNSQASWSTGLWGGDRPGWHLGTKEYDGDIGLVYTYQRWYQSEIGGFISGDRLLDLVHDGRPFEQYLTFAPDRTENDYTYAMGSPTRFVDVDGEMPQMVVGAIVGCGIGALGSGLMAAGSGGNVWKAAGCACLGGGIAGALSAAMPGVLGGAAGGGLGALAGRVCNCGFKKSFTGNGLEGTLVAIGGGAIGGAIGGLGGATGGISGGAAGIMGDAAGSITDSLNKCSCP